jgi:hypothetical protein
MAEPLCQSCRHLHEDGITCDAFSEPFRIPHAVLIGIIDHRGPVEGDRGIRYEPKNED